MIGGMVNGATMLCVDDHSPVSLLQAIRRDRPTHVGGSEVLLRSITGVEGWVPSDFDGLKAMTSKQRAFYFSLQKDNAIGRDQVPDAFGMTETIGPHSGVWDGRLQPAGSEMTWGRALDRMETKIVDPQTLQPVESGEVGELLVRGPWLMEGMYKLLRRDVFDVDGWYRTGDRCSINADGGLYFHGRFGAMIKTSGANVAPEEVEEAIRRVPNVLEVAVLPVDDPKAGQMVVAVVAPKPGRMLTEGEIKEHLRGELSSFKIPKRIFFMDYQSLPRTPSNKIRRPALVGFVLAELGRAA
jgi:acyl-CoA synthetase (AMP-forming)/AMP-acid ligase II